MAADQKDTTAQDGADEVSAEKESSKPAAATKETGGTINFRGLSWASVQPTRTWIHLLRN